MKYIPHRLSLCLSLSLICFSLTPNVGVASAQVQRPKPGDHHTAVENELLAEINLARTRPNEYAAYLEQLKPLYAGMEFKTPGGKAIVTQEGWKAVEEAIRFLRSTKAVPAFDVSHGMCFGAGELVKDQKASGVTGHKGSDGSFCEDRVTRFGTWAPPIGENLSYGSHTPRERVMALIVDDGVSNRGHRKRLFDTSYKVAGVACGDHSSMSALCVITLAGGFSDTRASKPLKNSPPSVTLRGVTKF